MDVLNEQVIDIGLRVTGYLAAAGLGMLLYSAIRGRRRATATVGTPEVSSEPTRAAASAQSAVQFVSLRHPQSNTVATRTEGSASTSPQKTDIRRDRPEIIRLARQMLKAGTPTEMIRRTLPISDAELAFLQSANAR
jgi:hypothetical protein